jgi:hypothetical protein
VALSPSKTIELIMPTEKVYDILLWQYKNSENLISYINNFAKELDELTKAVEDTINTRYLADAYGYQLDVIGEIVGIGRVFYGAAPIGYFGFYDDPQSKVPSIGDINTPSVGGIYKGSGQLDSNDLLLDDTSYRNIIYAKILQNSTNCRTDQVITFIDYVTGITCNTEITEPSPNTVDIFVHEDLDQLQRISISLTINMVRPAGVKLTIRDNRGIIDTTPYVNESLLKVRRLYDHKV